ncbi:hypothetical protein T484DRAFT_1884335 [Baffinella frigidus]|nr:hypothetical protein T484DRAFT_1884335 [Cryptophyta sp. CCMP2293]
MAGALAGARAHLSGHDGEREPRSGTVRDGPQEVTHGALRHRDRGRGVHLQRAAHRVRATARALRRQRGGLPGCDGRGWGSVLHGAACTRRPPALPPSLYGISRADAGHGGGGEAGIALLPIPRRAPPRIFHPHPPSPGHGGIQARLLRPGCALLPPLLRFPGMRTHAVCADAVPGPEPRPRRGGEGLGGTAMVAIRGFIPKEAFVHVVGGVEVPMIPVERKHVILPDARGGGAEGESFAGAAGGETGAFLNLLLQALTTEEAVAVCHLRSGPASAAGGEGGAAGGGAGADLDDTACFIMPGSGGGKADKGQHLVLLVPRLAGETGAARLHLLASTPVFDIPALRILPQHPPTSETLPSPDTLPADLAKFAKMLGQLPAKKDGAYKEAERLRRSSQVHMMPSVLAASSALIEAASQDLAAAAESSSAGGKDSDRGEQADRTLSAAILQDLREQLSRSDPSQVVVRPRTPPPAKRSKTTPNAAALSNLMN